MKTPPTSKVRQLDRNIRRRTLVALSTFASCMPSKIAYSHGFLAPPAAGLPDFLGIGVQKAGTSWLYKNLRCHEELFLPDLKELHYFDQNYYRSLNWYSSQFEDKTDRLCGEITPAYSVLPRRRIAFIRNTMPDIKLILLLRNPIDRAWSRARMNLMSPTGLNLSYEDITEHQFYNNFTHRASFGRGQYSKIIDNWLSEFPREQLFVGFFDDIQTKPRQLLHDIFSFLGVSLDTNWQSFPTNTVIYPGKMAALPDKYRVFLNDLYRSELQELYERFGDKILPWLNN